jgi:hypothetical protein
VYDSKIVTIYIQQDVIRQGIAKFMSEEGPVVPAEESMQVGDLLFVVVARPIGALDCRHVMHEGVLCST